DIAMAGLSGVQLCRLVKSDASTAHIPVVLLTGEDRPRSRFWAHSAGAAAYVSKESMRTTLVHEVTQVLANATRPSVIPARRGPPTRVLDLVCRVLDDLLFDAVLAARVRELVAV